MRTRRWSSTSRFGRPRLLCRPVISYFRCAAAVTNGLAPLRRCPSMKKSDERAAVRLRTRSRISCRPLSSAARSRCTRGRALCVAAGHSDTTRRAEAAIVGTWGDGALSIWCTGPQRINAFRAGATPQRPPGAADYCRQKNIRLLDDFDAVLASPDIDAVVLATPHSLHVEQICAGAAAAGKHVFVEKPAGGALLPRARAARPMPAAVLPLAAGFAVAAFIRPRAVSPAPRQARDALHPDRRAEPSAGKWEDIASWRTDRCACALAGSASTIST